MARNILLTRDEAENLVDLLEIADPKLVGTWRRDLARDIRIKFGMVSMSAERARDLQHHHKTWKRKKVKLNVRIYSGGFGDVTIAKDQPAAKPEKP